MARGNPEGEESSGQLPDRSSDSPEREPARLSFQEPSYEGLSYDELERRRRRSLARQEEAQDELGKWWKGKISFIEESSNREGTLDELQLELKRYDTYRERWEEIEAYSEKE